MVEDLAVVELEEIGTYMSRFAVSLHRTLSHLLPQTRTVYSTGCYIVEIALVIMLFVSCFHRSLPYSTDHIH